MNYKEKFLKSINKIAEKEIDKVNINQHYLEVLESQDKEIERLNKLINYKGIEDIPQYVSDLEVDNKQLKEENQLLNKNYNIINELEKWLKEKQFERIDNIGIYALYETVLQKLQELKGSDKE